VTTNLVGKRIKDNSRRKYTGGGRRPDKRAQRQAEAIRRNATWARMIAIEQLQALDLRFGEGAGATKQRIRLTAQLQRMSIGA
jgi:hypothetical protein